MTLQTKPKSQKKHAFLLHFRQEEHLKKHGMGNLLDSYDSFFFLPKKNNET